MTDDQLLDTLCEAWHSTWSQIAKADTAQDRRYWYGAANGIACAVAVCSGVPDRIRFIEAVRAGTEIARIRPRRTLGINGET